MIFEFLEALKGSGTRNGLMGKLCLVIDVSVLIDLLMRIPGFAYEI